ncbi:hypothetical protein KSP40_PGU012056 [Platanthera guangdongensis]|uniref:Uncharacterized protein n=1 Tax=Platanthera guangdongensis TaxID=2320717 RepID=A0ABR2LFU5_9ASPA
MRQKLVRLNLTGNGFIHEISPAFSNLSHMRTLFLQRNQRLLYSQKSKNRPG